MRDPMQLFEDFDRGLISRRQLLYLLGVAVATRPAIGLRAGQCGGARAGTPECDPTPAKLPFEPTGWKTVLLDHFSVQVADYEKEAAYYAALMNWKVRSDDGTQGDARHRRLGRPRDSRRLSATAAAAPTPPAPATAAGARRRRRGGRSTAAAAAAADARRAWRCSTLLLGHRAVGREESRSRAEEARAESGRRQPRQGLPELPREGSGRIRSADQQRQQRRTAGREPANGKIVGAGAVRVHQLEDGLARSHFVRGRRTTRRQVAFYHALLGWKPGTDEGSQNTCEIGDIGGIIIRRGGGGGRARAACRGSAAAPRAVRDRPHLVRHRAVRSRRR